MSCPLSCVIFFYKQSLTSSEESIITLMSTQRLWADSIKRSSRDAELSWYHNFRYVPSCWGGRRCQPACPLDRWTRPGRRRDTKVTAEKETHNCYRGHLFILLFVPRFPLRFNPVEKCTNCLMEARRCIRSTSSVLFVRLFLASVILHIFRRVRVSYSTAGPVTEHIAVLDGSVGSWTKNTNSQLAGYSKTKHNYFKNRQGWPPLKSMQTW